MMGQKHMRLLKQFDPYGVITDFAAVSVGLDHSTLYFFQKLIAVRRLVELSNAILLYALAVGEILNTTDPAMWPQAMVNGTLLHSRMSRRSFQGLIVTQCNKNVKFSKERMSN